MSLIAKRPVVDNQPPNGSIEQLDTATLAEIVSGLAIAEELWRPHVAHDRNERARIRLMATPIYEVWLLGWTPGQSVGLHDHGRANGAFIIVDGTLTETLAHEPGDRRSPALTNRTLTIADVAVIEAGEVHDVANRSTALATSIHAYSKPLRAMNFYDTSQPYIRGQRISTMLVEHQPPVLTALDD